MPARSPRASPAAGAGAASRAQAFAALQRAAGNRTLQRLIDRDRPPTGVAAPALRSAVPARGAAAADRVQRATAFSIGALAVNFDIDGLTTARPAMVAAFKALFLDELAGEPQWNAVELNWLEPMTTPQVKWFYYATEVLSDVYDDGYLAEFKAMRALALAAGSPAPDDPEAFGRFVLTRSGWVERELPKTLPALGLPDLAAVGPQYERPAAPDTGVIPPLDQKRFDARFSSDLILLLDAHDPANFESIQLPIQPAKGIADVVQAEAVAFFAPYAPSAKASIAVTDFRYSSRIYDVAGNVINDDLRKNYIRNRAEQLPLLDEVHFSGKRPEDGLLMEGHIENLVKNSNVADMVDRQLHVTGRAGHGGSVGLTSTYQKLADSTDVAKRKAHWARLQTICHELMHVMCHPIMDARAAHVSFGQVIKEGFTEVLGVQLFKAILTKAGVSDPFKARIDGGIDLGAIPDLGSVTESYGDAAVRAKAILARVGDDRFRAAYFLGAVDKVGL
ncbi:MAG: hypothetical protein WEB13_01470 [Dehalococcoidia bacterium]